MYVTSRKGRYGSLYALAGEAVVPEEPWITRITITCENPALRSFWQEIEDQLRMISARCGFDTRHQTEKLRDVAKTLDEIRLTTCDMTKPPHKRFK